MNEKILAGIGGGLIFTSFLIIVLFFVAEGVDEKYIQNGTPGFSQLQTIRDDAKESIQNSTIVENFRQLLGNVTYEMKDKISIGINETIGGN